MKIVLANYNENLNWIVNLHGYTFVIYQKGNLYEHHNINNILDTCQFKILPNVGREGHTYYTYIYDHYEELDDWTVFLQGYPFDHSPNLLMQLEKGWLEEHVDFSKGFVYLSDKILECSLDGCMYHHGLPLRKTYQTIFGSIKEPFKFRFGAGAQFCVSKERILSRPRTFYATIAKMLEYENCPIEGYCIERFHEMILGDVK